MANQLILKPGDRNYVVGVIQQQLNTIIYAGLIIDNIYGPATESAVRAFQARAGLPTTGFVDPETWYRLNSGDPLPETTVEESTVQEGTLSVAQAEVYSAEINRGQKTLTLFRGGSPLSTYPVAVGKPTTPTPLGQFPIRNKAVNPGGAFGTRWLGLTANGIGIHGTNAPSSIGLAVSNGCIRMFNQDVEAIFPLLNVGNIVRIIAGEESTMPAPNQSYTVRSGDTLFLIAQRFGTTVSAIMNANQLTSPAIRVGQTLIIPVTATPPPVPTTPTPPAPQEPGTTNYVVRAGDTLYRIAQSFNTTLATLRQLNNLQSDALAVGQVLRVPIPAASEIYTVRAGDTLYAIAQRFRTTVTELRAINNLTTDTIYVGQQLRVPITGLTPPTTPPPTPPGSFVPEPPVAEESPVSAR